jgi:hypothetical protein
VRAVSPDQGAAFAREHGCLYKETSAKMDKGGVHEGVYDALVWGECVHIKLVGRCQSSCCGRHPLLDLTCHRNPCYGSCQLQQQL